MWHWHLLSGASLAHIARAVLILTTPAQSLSRGIHVFSRDAHFLSREASVVHTTRPSLPQALTCSYRGAAHSFAVIGLQPTQHHCMDAYSDHRVIDPDFSSRVDAQLQSSGWCPHSSSRVGAHLAVTTREQPRHVIASTRRQSTLSYSLRFLKRFSLALTAFNSDDLVSQK